MHNRLAISQKIGIRKCLDPLKRMLLTPHGMHSDQYSRNVPKC